MRERQKSARRGQTQPRRLGLTAQERQRRKVETGAAVIWNLRAADDPQGNSVGELARLEAENAALRQRSVELALQIQELKEQATR